MVILWSYHMEQTPGEAVVRFFCDDAPLCPSCRERLSYRDSVFRRCREQGGNRRWFTIPRGQCPVCGTIHRMLPIILTPFKHYLTAIIAEILDGRLTAADLALIDHPCDMTVTRWRLWAGDAYENLRGDPRYDVLTRRRTQSGLPRF